jgi:hypothetical protein
VIDPVAADGVTVAVNVTFWPVVAGFGEDVRTVEVVGRALPVRITGIVIANVPPAHSFR